MPQTLLARKSGPQDNAIATDDTHANVLTADPSISAFPNNNNTTGDFNMPTQSFGSSFGGAPAQNVNTFGGQTSLGGNFSGSNPPVAPAPQMNLTQAGDNAAQGADVLVANDNTDWINKKWRPAMGWIYMLTCTADFVIFPVLWSLLQAMSKGSVTSQWQPLTLQGAGLYHIAMGAVLGIAAYGRTKEKIEGAAK